MSDVAPALADLIEGLMTFEGEELTDLLAAHGEKILLHPERNIVVVKGGCTGEALVAVATVPDPRMKQLGSFGLGSLREHWAEQN